MEECRAETVALYRKLKLPHVGITEHVLLQSQATRRSLRFSAQVHRSLIAFPIR